MTPAKTGDAVKVHYTGKLDDGSVFDSSRDRDPLEFTVGEQQLIPAFEEAVIGMESGDSKTIHVPAEEAYGPYRDENVITVERTEIPAEIELAQGTMLQMQDPGGRVMVVKVKDLDENNVTLDANHELAGKDLTFDIELVGIS